MATSGSYDYSLTAAAIIQAAYEDLGEIQPGATVPTAHSTMALVRLNMLAKQLQGNSDMAPGLKIHTRQRINLWFAKGQQTYLVGPGSSDARAATLWGRTTISADEAAAQTVLSITSNTDTTTFPGSTVTMTAADIVGIELNDGTIQWTTISGTPAATMTVGVALISAANAGNYVWWFTLRAQRFPLIETAVLRDENYNDSPLAIYKEVSQYAAVASKYADGTPTAILVEPLRTQTRVTLNSQPTDVTKTVVLTVLYPAEDYDATTDDIAFPQEYLRFMAAELAFMLSGAIGRWDPSMEANRKEASLWARSLNPEVRTEYFQSAT